MKKKLILFLISAVFAGAYGQDIDYNRTKGYMVSGYDVVSYFNGSPQKGNEKFTAIYNTVKLKFRNQENLAVFQADPVKYLPQYGGWCAYAMAKSGEKVPVNPKTYEIRDGKLYLFYNKYFNNTLKSWIKEKPSALILQADMNWEKIKYKKD